MITQIRKTCLPARQGLPRFYVHPGGVRKAEFTLRIEYNFFSLGRDEVESEDDISNWEEE